VAVTVLLLCRYLANPDVLFRVQMVSPGEVSGVV
jgi:hypothetical protein